VTLSSKYQHQGRDRFDSDKANESEHRDICSDEAVLFAMFGEHGHQAISNVDSLECLEARKAELDVLSHRQMFRILNRIDVPADTRIYRTRWVDTYKSDGTKNSRLVSQNYKDAGASEITTRAPTIGRLGQRLMLALGASMPRAKEYVRAISQACTQSESTLERSVFLEGPP
jgi:hypothetical protein